MRVLAITNLFPNSHEPNRGCFNLQQFQALREHCDLRVVAPIAWQPWVHGLRRPVPHEACWDGIPTTYPLYLFTPRVGRSAYGLEMYASLRKTVLQLAQTYRPDVLLVTWAYPEAVAGAMLARQLGLPWVAKVHGSDVDVFTRIPTVRGQIRRALQQASCTFAVSGPLKARLVEIGVPADKVRVQHNGVDVQRFRLMEKAAARGARDLPQDRPVILYVGNLKEGKGVLDLIEAARAMAARAGRPPLIAVVGSGPARAAMAEKIERYGLGEHVRLLGVRPHDEIPGWMAASDLLCLPSHQEGCPNVVLEAQACGRPVVACCVGAIPEFIDGTNGALVAPQDPEKLAEALWHVAHREWDAASLRQRVASLSWEANARALADELEKAVMTRSRRSSLEAGVRV